MARKKLTEKSVLKAIKGSGGNRSEIARRLHCQWHTSNNFIMSNETLRQAYESEREIELDAVESKGLELAKGGDGAMIRFILATIGKSRGYTTEESTPAEAGAEDEINVICDGEDVEPVDIEGAENDTMAETNGDTEN